MLAKKTFELLAKLTSIFFSYKAFKLINRFVKLSIWHSVRGKFARVGNDSYIEWPFLLSGPENIYLGGKFSALSCLRIETFTSYGSQTFKPKLVIGDNVAFNNDCHIACINSVRIGNNVLGASRIYITDHYHGEISAHEMDVAPVKRNLHSKGPVIIGDNVWIGEGVVILPGVTIGENVIVGANSVVNRDVPANAVVAGAPAKVIRILSR